MQPHPYADLFPMMDKKALQELVASIRDDGLEQPIVTFEGKILDGRNRALACANAQVEPSYVKYKGDDPLGFVVRHNLIRRHLTTSQRSMIAAELANIRLGDNQHSEEGVSIDTASDMLNVGRASTARAKKVLDSGDDELIESVKSGETSVNAAVQQISEPAKPTKSQAVLDSEKLLSLWDKSSAEAHRLFLEAIGVD
ncbi:ParB N-terminal domain-containing protein [bacterium]|nr:ParB N-terminal domain-containing protein [bacterium]